MSKLFKFSLLALTLLNGVYSCGANADKSKKETINDTHSTQLQDRYISNDSDKNTLQKKFDGVLLKFDSLTVYNTKLAEKYSDDLLKITKTKSEINRILLHDKLTTEEKFKAERLINHIDSVLKYINGKN
jgi:hypothetical protein